MAELLAALGAASSIITVYESCTKLYDTIQSSCSHSKDLGKLELKLQVEKWRLLAWGKSLGLDPNDGSKMTRARIYDKRINEEPVRGMVEGIFCNIQDIFHDSNGLRKRYGLKPCGEDGAVGRSSGTGAITFETVYRSYQERILRRQKNTSVPHKLKWAIGDCDKFGKLVHDLHGWNNDLANITASFQSLQAQRDALVSEVGSVIDESDLQSIAEVCSEDNVEIADIAQNRLRMIETLSTTSNDKTYPEEMHFEEPSNTDAALPSDSDDQYQHSVVHSPSLPANSDDEYQRSNPDSPPSYVPQTHVVEKDASKFSNQMLSGDEVARTADSINNESLGALRSRAKRLEESYIALSKSNNFPPSTEAVPVNMIVEAGRILKTLNFNAMKHFIVPQHVLNGLFRFQGALDLLISKLKYERFSLAILKYDQTHLLTSSILTVLTFIAVWAHGSLTIRHVLWVRASSAQRTERNNVERILLFQLLRVTSKLTHCVEFIFESELSSEKEAAQQK